MKRGRERMSEAGKQHTGNQYSKVEGLSASNKPSVKHDTRREIAKDLGWSTDTVAQPLKELKQ